MPRAAVQLVDEVIKRSGIADFLNGKSIRGLSVDCCCQPLNLLVVDGLSRRTGGLAGLE
jgi:hypothetical protein